MQVPIEIIFKNRGKRNDRNTVGSTKALVTPKEKVSGEKALFVLSSRSHFYFCIIKKEIASFIHLHTASSITNPSSWAHPRAPWGQYNIINSPGVGSHSVVGLNPSEPGPGRSNQGKHTEFDKKPWKHEIIYFYSFCFQVPSSRFQFPLI